jgi:uncharacterized membrane protein
MERGGYFKIAIGVVGLAVNVFLLDHVNTPFSRAGYVYMRSAVTVFTQYFWYLYMFLGCLCRYQSDVRVLLSHQLPGAYSSASCC